MTLALRQVLGILFVWGAISGCAEAETHITHEIIEFRELKGWHQDDHGAALSVFKNTCADMSGQDWQALCAIAHDSNGEVARSFFEMFFRPVKIQDGKRALFTGYFEPELEGSRVPNSRYRYPVYKMPREARSRPWLTRRQILTSEVMKGRGLEIAWVDDPVELFFLQIQGSGRIRLANGRMIRVGYGGDNGHPYRSIGQELVRRGIYSQHQVSARVINNWVRKNPVDGAELLLHSPGYVFFREVTSVSKADGPLGAMNRSITPMRTVAVDPDFVPLGAPVWIDKQGKTPLRRLMVAQDTGSAIKGAQRADIFFGAGDEAGRMAGQLKDPGELIVLMPIQRAFALLPDDV